MIPIVVDSRARALQNPLLHWRLDEPSGLLLDSSGNAFNGTNDGATLGITGQIDLGAEFDGANDDITNTEAVFLDQIEGVTEQTLAFWAADTSENLYDCAISIGDGSGDDLSLYPYNTIGGGGFSAWYDNEDIITGAGSAVADGGWNHFALVQSAIDAIELFVNGVSGGTFTSDKAMNTSITEFALGYYIANGERYGGQLDDIRYYLRAFSVEEINFLASM